MKPVHPIDAMNATVRELNSMVALQSPESTLKAFLYRTASASTLTLAALLSACGGGGGSGDPIATASAADDTANAANSSSDQATSAAVTSSSRATAAAATDTTTWTVCATERAQCSFTGTRSVRYGTATKYVTASFSNGVLCGNAAFGDPAYGETKTCWLGSTTTATTAAAPTTTTSTATTWTQCAGERQQCSFTGTRSVRYGTTTKYVTASYSNGVLCSNATFGDPAYGESKNCWYSGSTATATTPTTTTSTTTPTTAAVVAPTTSTSSSTTTTSSSKSVANGVGPSVTSFTSSGPIVARTGQVIEKMRITSSSGSCITIPAGVNNVIIRDSEIGPCGQPGDTSAKGVDVLAGAYNITVQRNYIHDMATALYAAGARHPIIFDRNNVTNIRGPFPRGQMVQFNSVKSGSSSSKITCNVSDVQNATYRNVEDHINMFDSPGVSSTDRTEIAYNRIRGGHPTSNSGTAIMVGDGSSGGNVSVHHNTVVNVRNVGIGVAGGTNIAVESNRVYMDRSVIYTNVGMYVWSQGGGSCSGHSVKGNRAWVASSNGSQNPWWNGGNCGTVDLLSNLWGDATLNASMFSEVPSQCS